ncbi:CpaF family protein [Anaeromyxobacter paludicola]|uniref:Type II/IV secretion system-related protein n=1 Tax=Anaeromyxobacter paludicola TaxID=2918171 RepID=A0ABM7X9J9_9BACT|nr:CpaF family protein [Anaeromyxobacter paludicola]BDG08490.1 type II/IV secretion system-related protein [Anaeromyxobacter paludicola]
MQLSERLKQGSARVAGEAGEPSEAFHKLKGELHRRLIDKLDLETLQKLTPERLREDLRATLAVVVADTRLPLNQPERERMIQELLDEVTGLGPLEPLLADPGISDILVNTFSTVYIERGGKLELTRVRFDSDDHLLRVIGRIVSRVGRRIDETSPMVDARLPDGSRVNAIIPPLAIDGPILSIRRFGVRPLRVADLLALGALTEEAIGFLAACVHAKVNILVSGGTGTGKTTMLNALSAFIPPTERIVTIEDSAELQLQQPHVVRLETRPPNVEGRGEVMARDLVRNSLRMRPDRIVIGEVRGAEVLDMLQAMNTGHEGSMTTIHANGPRDALTRLEAMIGMAGVPLSEQSTHQMISRAIQIVVQLTRGSDGRRRLTSVTEITGSEGNTITMQEVYRFDQKGVDATGKVLGRFVSCGIRPRVMDRIERAGVDPAKELAKHLGR